ncbi:Protein of unknown function [Gryllus bimaculatus]|nr:Protein of unknown function [Gryllus bimaculatus]
MENTQSLPKGLRVRQCVFLVKVNSDKEWRRKEIKKEDSLGYAGQFQLLWIRRSGFLKTKMCSLLIVIILYRTPVQEHQQHQVAEYYGANVREDETVPTLDIAAFGRK